MSRRFVSALLALCLGMSAVPAEALLWPSEVNRLERDLGAADVDVRRRAAGRIAELGERVAARLLARAFDDPDVEVRLSAASAARALGVPGFGERVMGWLTDPDARLRLEAIELLSTAPSARAIGPLTRALSDVEPSVRSAAATALGRSGAPEAVVGLLGRLDDSAVEVETSVIRALSRLADARAVVPLISKIEDPRPEVRRAVARALGEIGDRRAVSALVLLLRDADEPVRVAAIGALGSLGDPAATPSVAALLGGEPSNQVRRAAIETLSAIGGAEAVAALMKKLGQRAEEQEALVAAFGRIGASAVSALTACLGSEPQRERADGCALSLARASGRDAGPVLRDAVRKGRVSRAVALSALAESGHPDALLLVLEQLGSDDPVLRRSALSAAAKLLDPRRPDGRAVEPLMRAFDSARGRRADRIELLRLLGRSGSPRAATLLGPIADRADDLELRVAALSALGSLATDATRPVLWRALSDREPAVRLAAALSLQKGASPASAKELLDRLERAEAQDRQALSLALSGAFAKQDSPELFARLKRAIDRSRDAERDALIEVLGHAPAESARGLLDALSKRADPEDRRKVAEVSASDAGARERLNRLAADTEPSVRSNALWALGAVGTRADLPSLERAFDDRDLNAAANAVSAYARIARSEKLDAAPVLCRQVAARRPALRASALSGLRLLAARCPERPERRLVSDDPSPRVRRAAVELVRDVQPSGEDQRALRRCVSEEPDGAVAVACAAVPARPVSGNERSLVFVVPVGEAVPTPRAAFALQRPDGLVRHGVADRRGAVYEVGLPDGELELNVPALFGD
jgi:HEAT repeat protein